MRFIGSLEFGEVVVFDGRVGNSVGWGGVVFLIGK